MPVREEKKEPVSFSSVCRMLCYDEQFTYMLQCVIGSAIIVRSGISGQKTYKSIHIDSTEKFDWS